MNIQIHSFNSIENLAKSHFKSPTALISIGDVGRLPPNLIHKPSFMLRLNFDDISLFEIDYENSGAYAFRLFSPEYARQIANFVYENKDKVELFICQCEYGMSRSAAIAAAIKEHFYQNGIEIFSDDRYYPNNDVFRLTLEALIEKSTLHEKILQDKEKNTKEIIAIHEFKSAIILKDRIYIEETNSYENLLKNLNIEDSEYNINNTFIKAELCPYKNDLNSDIDKWKFVIHQDILPKWFIKEIYEQKMRESVKEWIDLHKVKDLIICNDVVVYANKMATEISIPNNIKSIGVSAFENCKQLTTIIIPNSVTKIGNSSFRKCTSLTNIIIPNSVISIGHISFYGCESLKSIAIPNSIINIGSFAFCNCKNLTSVKMPNNIIRIRAGLFCGCESLTSIDIPDSVTSIDGCAFDNCPGLTNIDTPNSIKKIGVFHFHNYKEK